MCAIPHCGSGKDAVIFKHRAFKKLQTDQKATHQEVLHAWKRLRLIPNTTANFMFLECIREEITC